MRFSVRDHRHVVHFVNYVAENLGAVWVPVMEAKTDARRTHRTFLAHAMCDVRVKIHHRTANRLGNEAPTCLLCMHEEEEVQRG